ncbi:hypothetical protein X975_01564, partial [Stegodyphus mimosarum]
MPLPSSPYRLRNSWQCKKDRRLRTNPLNCSPGHFERSYLWPSFCSASKPIRNWTSIVPGDAAVVAFWSFRSLCFEQQW